MTTVKNLIKKKQFIILVPHAVLSELDELKKHSDSARTVIRWLEQEFGQGSRFIRTQRLNETKNLEMIKIPKKLGMLMKQLNNSVDRIKTDSLFNFLDRDSNGFIQIAQFCNFMVSNNSNDMDLDRSNVLTYLIGENLGDKKIGSVSYSAILDSISVKCEHIDKFYRGLRNHGMDKRFERR